MPSTAGTDRATVTLRALRAEDGSVARALALPEIERSPYGVSMRSALDAVLAGTDPDSRGLVAIHDGLLVGLAVYGAIAGALGAGRLQLIVVDRDLRLRGIATQLVHSAVAALGAEGMRFVTVELPNDPALSAAKLLLLRCSFSVEATVADYFRDGVDLAILRRELTAG